MYPVIGIAGAAGAGKDTVADFLKPSGYERYSLALPIKLGLNAMFGWSMEQWNDREWKERVLPEFGVSPRRLAQTLGTEWGRETVSPDLWVQLASNHYRMHVMPLIKSGRIAGVVIPDIRFPNEVEWVRRWGGKVWYIDRPGVAAVAAHKSEGALPLSSFDRVLHNTGSLDRLRLQVSAYLHGVAQADSAAWDRAGV
jgi:hypothetical protein